MNMTSNSDVTNSAHQIQMDTLCHWMNASPKKIFCVRHYQWITVQNDRPQNATSSPNQHATFATGFECCAMLCCRRACFKPSNQTNPQQNCF